jgi:hypothetical protein
MQFRMISKGYKMKTVWQKSIEALATPEVMARYAIETDQQLYLEGVIVDAGFDISLTDRPRQWERTIEVLERAMP